ncbi:sensor histidine kinase [Streptomyces radicis]|uniref:histidine kinase n=1 Tax=Streptomyces radicis TaxID=1750517 RepID=A0A3A9WBS8_9ACTN|nr:ATP-binding protein [Streptomyces radicis]RKN10548.1 sensor histidine kinase [Streptomyces radicis]RKN24808.1 sensor histidine kinase [Streptomyces radicis]
MSHRPRLIGPVTLAVLPAALVAAIAAATALLRDGEAPPVGAGLLTAAVLAGAVAAAGAQARRGAARLALLRRRAARGRVELQALLGKVERGERVGPPDGPPPAEPTDDPLDRLRHEIDATRYAAESAVSRAAAAGGAGGDARVEVFVHLARRMQTSVHRQIEYLDELRDEVKGEVRGEARGALDDPDVATGLSRVDRLATRLRRHAENLAVLGGAVPRRRDGRQVSVAEVLRRAAAEVEHDARVQLATPFDGAVRGDSAADVVHLLAELIENATQFSAPATQVALRARRVPAGVAVEVDDRGLGMTAAEQKRMNAVLAGADRGDATELLDEGHVGLFVVSTLAARHGIGVRLGGNVYGGVQAVALLPHTVLDEGAPAESHAPTCPVTTPIGRA